MSHVTCPKCGSNEHTSGYGLTCGPMGAYTVCDECDTFLEFYPDLEGLTDEQTERINKSVDEWREKVWGKK